MHTRQGVAEPALSQDNVRPDYVTDARARLERHRALWIAVELNWWQRLLLDGPDEVHV